MSSPLNSKLSIIGENFSASRRFSKYGSLSKTYEGVPQDSIQLLMSLTQVIGTTK